MGLFKPIILKSHAAYVLPRRSEFNHLPQVIGMSSSYTAMVLQTSECQRSAAGETPGTQHSLSTLYPQQKTPIYPGQQFPLSRGAAWG